MQRSLKKDDRAQMELYKMYANMAYRTAYQVLQDAPMAEDIMQESFLVAFDKLHQLKNEEGFGAWLKQIVYRKSIDQIRADKKMKLAPLDERENEVAMAPIEDTEIVEERLATLQKALSQLRPEAQQLLRLFYYQQLPHEEIAVALNISPGACRTRLARAKAELKNKMT
ncbi:MAG: RNA polymerase sigma factor [Flavobacteriaceae bacterium]